MSWLKSKRRRRRQSGPSGLLIACMVAGVLLMAGSLMQKEALAHKPLEPAGTGGLNSNIQSALAIPNPKISWAVYQSLDSENPALFYRFDARKGDDLYVQLSVPQLPGLQDFNPKLALVGPGVSESIVTEARRASVSANPSLVSPTGDDSSIITLSYGSSNNNNSNNNPAPNESQTIFYEPFTQTSYFQKQEFRAGLPQDGRYYLVVYVSGPQELKGSSKFTLAVGEIEDFQPLDFVTTLPLAWLKTKLFFEDYLSIMAVILIPSSLAAIVIFKFVRKKKGVVLSSSS